MYGFRELLTVGDAVLVSKNQYTNCSNNISGKLSRFNDLGPSLSYFISYYWMAIIK